MPRRNDVAFWAVLASLAMVLGVGRAAAERAVAPACPPHGTVTRSLTSVSTPLPRDGGAFVVAVEADATATTGTMDPPVVSFVRRRTTLTLVPTPIAPGLFRLTMPSRPALGAWTLHGLGPDASVTIGRAAMPGVPVRPSVRVMRRVAATGLSASREPRVEVHADLAFPVPSGVVAAIITWNADTQPSGWARAIVGQTEMIVFAEAAHCDAVPPGWQSPPSGPLTARIAWVDRLGQVSPPSDAVPVE
jgi:hypothetical protein